MFTLLIAAILLAMGIPAFNDVILGSKASAVVTTCSRACSSRAARAIKRNVPVTLCPSTDGAACDDSGDWEVGWIVLDPATAEVLQKQEAAPEHFKVIQTAVRRTCRSSRSAWARRRQCSPCAELTGGKQARC
jgi:type IV fimbrial biogenesis protein FimT